jgi:hypothetical protein
MFFNESKFRKILREEARRSLHEIAPLAVAAVAAPAIAGYRGYQNTQTRSAGLDLKYQDAAAPDPRLEALETDVRLVLYGGSATSSFFNMTADAGMFLKDLYLGSGGDFGDMSEESKEKIVFYTYSAIKKNVLTADSFYNYVKQIFKADPGTADEGQPQKEASATTEGTDTYFDMLSLIQNKFASGAPAAVDPAVDPAAAGPAGPAKDWPSYVAATPVDGAAVQAAWKAYAAATGVNAGFGTFARWYQANAKGLNPAQTAQKLASLSKRRGAAAPAGSATATAASAPVVVTQADTANHSAEAAAVKAAEAQVAAAEADPNLLTKKQKIAAALAARQAARAALVAARQRLRAVKQENMFRSDSNRLNENDQFQLKNLKITWGK